MTHHEPPDFWSAGRGGQWNVNVTWCGAPSDRGVLIKAGPAALPAFHRSPRVTGDDGGAVLATASAAQVLGPDHGVTKALAKASITMAKADLWQARLPLRGGCG